MIYVLYGFDATALRDEWEHKWEKFTEWDTDKEKEEWARDDPVCSQVAIVSHVYEKITDLQNNNVFSSQQNIE